MLYTIPFQPIFYTIVVTGYASVGNAVEELLTKSGMELSERIRLAIETLEESGE